MEACKRVGFVGNSDWKIFFCLLYGYSKVISGSIEKIEGPDRIKKFQLYTFGNQAELVLIYRKSLSR